MPITIETKAVDFAVSQAKSLPELIAGFEVVDPTLAESLKTKTLLASKSPWAQLVGSAVSIMCVKYTIGLDDSTQQMIAGGVVIVVNWVIALVMRYMTRGPIAGIVKTPT